MKLHVQLGWQRVLAARITKHRTFAVIKVHTLPSRAMAYYTKLTITEIFDAKTMQYTSFVSS